MTERLISPWIPFMQIRRLRHVQGQFGLYGQIINVPVAIYTMFYICHASRDGSFFFSVTPFKYKQGALKRHSRSLRACSRDEEEIYLQVYLKNKLAIIFIIINENFYLISNPRPLRERLCHCAKASNKRSYFSAVICVFKKIKSVAYSS